MKKLFIWKKNHEFGALTPTLKLDTGYLGASEEGEQGLETGGPSFKSGLRHFPAVWPWASHLTPIAYPYHSSALEQIHSIDSKMEGKGLKKKEISLIQLWWR